MGSGAVRSALGRGRSARPDRHLQRRAATSSARPCSSTAQGDGTWPIGKPGFLFWLEIEHADGRVDGSSPTPSGGRCSAAPGGRGITSAGICGRCRRNSTPGFTPTAGSGTGFQPDGRLAARDAAGRLAEQARAVHQLLRIHARHRRRPAEFRAAPAQHPAVAGVARAGRANSPRRSGSNGIPHRRITSTSASPDAFRPSRQPVARRELPPGQWRVELDGTRGAALTFEFAGAGRRLARLSPSRPRPARPSSCSSTKRTRPAGRRLLNTHFDSWTRFICREGMNRFETFDFESLRWLQLHIHSAKGPVTIRDVGVRRRVFPWPNEPARRSQRAGAAAAV